MTSGGSGVTCVFLFLLSPSLSLSLSADWVDSSVGIDYGRVLRVDPRRRVLGGGPYSEWNRSPVAQSQWVTAKETTITRGDPSSVNLIAARESSSPIKINQ